MSKSNQEYKAINCSFYDLLLSKATLKENVTLTYKSEVKGLVNLNDFIKTIITKDKAEYLILMSDKAIRLDYIVSVNGIELNRTNCSL